MRKWQKKTLNTFHCSISTDYQGKPPSFYNVMCRMKINIGSAHVALNINFESVQCGNWKIFPTSLQHLALQYLFLST